MAPKGLHIRGFGPELEALVAFYRSPQIRDEPFWHLDLEESASRKWSRRDSNPEPFAYKANALTGLSYGTAVCLPHYESIVERAGIEPATPGFSVQRSTC